MCNSYFPNPNHTENLTCRIHGADNGDVHTPHVGNDKGGGGIQFFTGEIHSNQYALKGELPFLKEHG